MSDITKRALSASLKSLLLEKPIDKVSVLDITNRCGVKRQTFYYHFQDIADLVEWTCLDDASNSKSSFSHVKILLPSASSKMI